MTALRAATLRGGGGRRRLGTFFVAALRATTLATAFAVGFGVAVMRATTIAVGFGVGLAVGFAVGLAVGFAVGLAVGLTVGFGVGAAVGCGTRRNSSQYHSIVAREQQIAGTNCSGK